MFHRKILDRAGQTKNMSAWCYPPKKVKMKKKKSWHKRLYGQKNLQAELFVFKK
jgi:hypothetical protein